MAPKDFTVPAASEFRFPTAELPAPAAPTPWQRFLLFLRNLLIGWIRFIDRHLGA